MPIKRKGRLCGAPRPVSCRCSAYKPEDRPTTRGVKRQPIRIWPAEALTGLAARRHPLACAHQEHTLARLALARRGADTRQALRLAAGELAGWDATDAISHSWFTLRLKAQARRLGIGKTEAARLIDLGWTEGARYPRCVYPSADIRRV